MLGVERAVLGSLLIGLNAAAAFGCCVTFYMYSKVLVRAYIDDESYKWTTWVIVLSALAGCLFFGNFAFEFHLHHVDPLTSSLAALPIRLLYLSLTLASTACAVGARFRGTEMGAWRTFVLWSLFVAVGVALLTAYEASE